MRLTVAISCGKSKWPQGASIAVRQPDGGWICGCCGKPLTFKPVSD